MFIIYVTQRFKSLEKRADEVTKTSTEKRIKHLQKQVIETGMCIIVYMSYIDTEYWKQLIQKSISSGQRLKAYSHIL